MIADITFTVNLEAVETEIIQLVLSGKSDSEIRAHISLKTAELNRVFEDLSVSFNLMEATRENKLTWVFHREQTPKTMTNEGR